MFKKPILPLFAFKIAPNRDRRLKGKMQNKGTKLEFLDSKRKVVDFKAWQSRRELENAGFEIKQSAPGKVRLLLRIRKSPPILLPYR